MVFMRSRSFLLQYSFDRYPADVPRAVPRERCHGFDFPVIVDPYHIPGVDDLAITEANAAVPPVDRTIRAQADAIIEDKRASLRFPLAHSVRIEQGRRLRGIPAENLDSVALFQSVLDEGQAPAGVFLAAEFMFCPGIPNDLRSMPSIFP